MWSNWLTGASVGGRGQTWRRWIPGWSETGTVPRLLGNSPPTPRLLANNIIKKYYNFAISEVSQLQLLGIIRQERLELDGLFQPFVFATSRAPPRIGKQKCVFQSSAGKVRVVAIGSSLCILAEKFCLKSFALFS